MNFITTNRSNPCPICADVEGKCRSKSTDFTLADRSTINDQLFLCMVMHQDNNGFKFTGDTNDGLWGKFISYDLSQSLSEAWRKKRSKNNQPRVAKPLIIKRPPTDKSKPQYQHLLKISQRSQAIALVLSQLSLTSAHLAALIKRGFTKEQIEEYGFKSVRYHQPLTIPISNRLAGIADDGKHLTNKFTGLIVPIRNPQGLYIGWQYRLDRASNCRYLWAKSNGVSSHLSEYSELPLSFNLPSGSVTNYDYIALTEGVGFKPQLTANQFGLISLGASGGMFAASPKLLAEYLKQTSTISKTKSVLLFPDAGAVKNPLVLKQYKRTIDLVQSLGYNVQIAWWGQINKSCPDPDEFKGDYRVISTEQFFNFGLKYSAFFPNKDNQNAVRQFLNLLKDTNNPVRLKNAIALFKSRYAKQFNLIKQICWKHLDPQRQQFIHQLYS